MWHAINKALKYTTSAVPATFCHANGDVGINIYMVTYDPRQ